MKKNIAKTLSAFAAGGVLLFASMAANADEYRSPMERFFGLTCDQILLEEVESSEKKYKRCARLYRRLESMQKRLDAAEKKLGGLDEKREKAVLEGKDDIVDRVDDAIERVQERIDRLSDNLFPYHDS